MRRQLLISTIALVAGLGVATAQETPKGAGGQGSSAVQKQESHGSGAAAKQESRGSAQSHETRGENKGGEQGKQAQHEKQNTTAGQGGREQGRNEQGRQAQEKSSTAGQGKRNEAEHAGSQQGKQAQEGKQPRQDKQTQQSKQTQQGKEPQQSKQAEQGKQNQPKQSTTGQGQREQGREAQSNQSKQGREGQQGQAGQRANQQGERGQGQTGQAQQGRNDQAGQQGRTGERGTVQLSEQQRTEIRQNVFAGSNVPRVNNVNFALNVGTVVPTDVHVVAVPDVIVRYYPQFREDMYFVVRDDIVIVDRSHKIVATMPVGSSGAQLNTGSKGSVGVASRGGSANMSVEEIREMQQVLIQEGFDVTVDGKMGPKTKEALMAFQRKNGLEATGQMNRETMTKLGINERGGEGSTVGQGRQGEQRNAPQGRQQDEHGNTANQGRQNEPGNAAQNRQNEQDGNNPSTVGQGQQGQQNRPAGSNVPPNNDRRDKPR
jgi:peptidoglycan hydrolase-like protein with peptidoglycan-binding domain